LRPFISGVVYIASCTIGTVGAHIVRTLSLRMSGLGCEVATRFEALKRNVTRGVSKVSESGWDHSTLMFQSYLVRIGVKETPKTKARYDWSILKLTRWAPIVINGVNRGPYKWPYKKW